MYHLVVFFSKLLNSIYTVIITIHVDVFLHSPVFAAEYKTEMKWIETLTQNGLKELLKTEINTPITFQ